MWINHDGLSWRGWLFFGEFFASYSLYMLLIWPPQNNTIIICVVNFNSKTRNVLHPITFCWNLIRIKPYSIDFSRFPSLFFSIPIREDCAIFENRDSRMNTGQMNNLIKMLLCNAHSFVYFISFMTSLLFSLHISQCWFLGLLFTYHFAFCCSQKNKTH